MEDFDSTLYFLDAEEVSYLRREAEREYATDLRRTVLAALLDVFETQADPAVRQEVMRNIDALTLHLLAGRQFSTVAFLLREIDAVLERARGPHARATGTAGEPPGPAERPGRALAAAARAGRSGDAAACARTSRSSLPSCDRRRSARYSAGSARRGTPSCARCSKARRSGSRSRTPPNCVRLIASADGTVALEAVKRAGGFKTVAAVPALGGCWASPIASSALAAVTALVEIGTPGAMQALEKALEDDDRDVRVAAIRALGQNAYRPALPKVTALVKASRIREADRTERLAIFELFGTLCGDGGVPWLDKLLNPQERTLLQEGGSRDPRLRRDSRSAASARSARRRRCIGRSRRRTSWCAAR